MSDFINMKLKVGLTDSLKQNGLPTITANITVIPYTPPFSDFCEISGIFQRILCCSAFLSGLKDDIRSLMETKPMFQI